MKFLASIILSAALSFSVYAADAPQTENPNIRLLLVPLVETVLSGEIAARIEKITVRIGDRFKSGQDLVIFDCEMYHNQLRKAKAELDEAQKTLEVNQRLEKLQSVSQLEISVSRARAEGASADVALRKTQVNKCSLKAPFAGRVVKVRANPFEYVSPGQPLIEVLDDIHLNLQLYVPSKWLKWLKKDTKFSIHIDETGKNYSAHVTSLGARMDPVSQTLEIRAEVEGQNPELLAGMSGTAQFTIPENP